jgi:hypothetical protein
VTMAPSSNVHLAWFPIFCLFPLLIAFVVAQGTASAVPARVLIYSAAERYRHDSRPSAIAALTARASSIHVQFDATEDKRAFNDGNLSRYDAVLFLSTTGEGGSSLGHGTLLSDY